MKNDSETGAMSPEKTREFSKIASEIFAPIYPVIAEQILDRTGITQGRAIDIGSGPGDLAIEVAKRSSLTVYALDISPDMYSIADQKIRAHLMHGRVIPILGDVHQMSFPDSSIDVILSRGSWFFWEDPESAFREIHRVLSPEGYAYIGSGFGSAALSEKIVSMMQQQDPEWKKGDANRGVRCDPDHLGPILASAGFSEVQFIQDNSGFWMVLHK